MKAWKLLILILVLSLIFGGILYLSPNYDYDGIADTPEKITLVLENTDKIAGNEAIIAYYNLTDDQVYYHFTSRTEIEGLEYDTDYSSMILVPFLAVLLFGVGRIAGDK